MNPRTLLDELSLLGLEQERPFIIGAVKFSRTTRRSTLDALAAELRRQTRYTHVVVHGRAGDRVEHVLGFSYEVAPFRELRTFFAAFEAELMGSLRKRFGEALIEWEIIGAMHMLRPVIHSLSPTTRKGTKRKQPPSNRGGLTASGGQKNADHSAKRDVRPRNA